MRIKESQFFEALF